MVKTEREPASDRQAKDAQQGRDGRSTIPAPPSRKIHHPHEAQFFDYLPSLTEKDWAHATIYVYRMWPITKATGVKYIDKLGEPITMDTMLQRFGAGKYMLKLTDQSRKPGEICEARVHLDHDWETYPPVLDWEEIDLVHKDNQGIVQWARAKGFLKMQQGTAPANDNTALIGLLTRLIGDLQTRKPSNEHEAKAIEKITDMFATANQKSIEMTLKQQDPGQMLTLLTMLEKIIGRDNSSEKLLDFVVKMQPGASNNEALLKMLFESQTRQMELFQKLVDSRVTAIDPMEQMTKMLGVLGQVRETFGGGEGGGSSAPWYAQLAGYIFDKTPEILRNGADLMRAMNQRSPGAPPPAPTRTAGVADLPPAPPPQPTADTTGQNNGGQTSQMNQQMLMQMAQMVLGALARGIPGDQFAESIDTMYGFQVYSMVADAGKEQILAQLKTTPLWEKFSAVEPQLDRFIDDFLAYNEPPPGEGEPGAEGKELHRVK